MKKLIAMFMFLAFLVLPLTVQADCSHYGPGLVDQCFVTTVDDTEFTLCFGLPVFGPCPCGTAILSYVDRQIIGGVEYEAIIEIDCDYDTTPDVVTVAGLDFILADGKLILLPDENPLIFNQIVED